MSPPFPSVRGTTDKTPYCYHAHTAHRPQDKPLLLTHREGDVATKMAEHGVEATGMCIWINIWFSGFGELFFFSLNDIEA